MEVSWEWRICIYYTDSLHTHSGFHTGTAFSEWTNFSICSSRRQKAIWSAPKIYSAFQFSTSPVFRGQSTVHWNLQLLWAVPRTAGRWSHGTNYTVSFSSQSPVSPQWLFLPKYKVTNMKSSVTKGGLGVAQIRSYRRTCWHGPELDTYSVFKMVPLGWIMSTEVHMRNNRKL